MATPAAQSPETGKTEKPDPKQSASADVKSIGQAGDAQHQAQAFHDANVNFVSQVYQSISDPTARAAALQAYQTAMRTQLGDAKFRQYEDLWLAHGTTDTKGDAFKAMGAQDIPKAFGGTYSAIEGASLGDRQVRGRTFSFQPQNGTSVPEAEFEKMVAADISSQWKNGDFGSLTYNIERTDLDQRADALKGSMSRDSQIADQATKDQQFLTSGPGKPYTDALNDKVTTPAGKTETVAQYLSEAYGNNGPITPDVINSAKNDPAISPADRDRLLDLANNWSAPAPPGGEHQQNAFRAAQLLRGAHVMSAAETDAANQPNTATGGLNVDPGPLDSGDFRYTSADNGITMGSLADATGTKKPADVATPPEVKPTAAQDAAQLKQDAAALSVALQSGAVPLADLGMKSPSDPISKASVDAKLAQLQGMGLQNMNDAQKAEMNALNLLHKHWDEIATKPGAQQITTAQLSEWAVNNGAEFRGVGVAGPVVQPEGDPAALTAAQKAQLDKFQFNPTDKEATVAPGQGLYQFWQSQSPPGSTPQQVREHAKEIGKANGLVTPQNEKYWDEYVRDGKSRHLPAVVGQFFDSHKPWKIPGEDIGQQKQQAAEAAVGPMSQQMQLSPQDAAKVTALFNQYYRSWPFDTPRPTDPRDQALALNAALQREGGLGHIRGYQGVAAAIEAAKKLHDAQLANAMKYIDANQGT